MDKVKSTANSSENKEFSVKPNLTIESRKLFSTPVHSTDVGSDIYQAWINQYGKPEQGKSAAQHINQSLVNELNRLNTLRIAAQDSSDNKTTSPLEAILKESSRNKHSKINEQLNKQDILNAQIAFLQQKNKQNVNSSPGTISHKTELNSTTQSDEGIIPPANAEIKTSNNKMKINAKVVDSKPKSNPQAGKLTMSITSSIKKKPKLKINMGSIQSNN